jgi:hypothetical protein
LKEPKTEQDIILYDEGPNHSDNYNSGRISAPERHRRRKARLPVNHTAIPQDLLLRLKKALKNQIAGCDFCSRSEAVCAVLMEHYIPGFLLIRGTTFQIPVNTDRFGNEQCVDFAVENILFEYHPVRFWKKEYKTYSKVFKTLKADTRAFFHSIMRQKLVENYTRRRRALLDQNKNHRRTELVVADSPADFYSKIIKRFGRNYPPQSTFEAIFEALRRKGKKAEE